MTSSDYFYLLLLMMAVLFAKGFISGGGIRPTFIYCLVMMLYPIVTLGMDVLKLHLLYPWVKTYADVDYVRFAQISLAAIMPLYLLAFFSSKGLQRLECMQVKSIFLNGFERQFLIFVFVIYFAYAAVNAKQILFGGYAEFQAAGGHKSLAAMDYLIFFALLLRLPVITLDFSKAEKVLMLLYFGFKLVSGGRMFMVTIGMAMLLVYMAKHRPTPQRVRKMLLFSPLVAVLMGLAVLFREKSSNFLMAGFSLSQEYINSTMGALKVAHNSVTGEGEEHLDMLLDPILSMIPSVVYERSNFAYFAYIEERFGGWQGYNPIGGSYLPHEVFLIYPNLLFVFAYFTAMAVILYFVEKQLFSSSIVKMSSLGFSIRIALLSIFLVFSVRHYFYVHVKHLFICLGFTSAFYLFSVAYTGLLKLSLRGNARLRIEIRQVVMDKNL
ncbi:MAG: hypothetical protein PHU06_07675 [Gallionella sp.]|nr:hypothetical protein [Gallionella sp.]